MKWLKQMGLWLMLTVVLGLLLWMAFPSLWEDLAASAFTGQQNVQYVQAAVSSEGVLYAVGHQDGDWRLVRGNNRGRLTLQNLGITDVLSVSELYACADGGAVMAVYEEKEDLLCRVYYIGPEGKMVRQLLSIPCQGGMKEDVRLSGFAERGGAVAFLLERGADVAVYCYTLGEDNARKLADIPAYQAEYALYALPDGSAALVREDVLTVGASKAELPRNVSVLKGWSVQDGACVLDGRKAVIWRILTDSGKTEQLTELGSGVVDVSVSSDGRVAILTDSGTLQVWRNGVEQDHSSMLYRQRWQSIALLALGAVVVVLLALVLWYVLWELRKMELSLVVRYGMTVAVVLVLMTAAAVHWMVEPHYEEQAAVSAESYLRTAALAAPEPVSDPLGADWDFDETLTTRAEYVYALWRAFGSPQVPLRNSFDDIPADSPYAMAAEWAKVYNVTVGTGERQFSPEMVLTEEQAFTFMYRAMRYIGGDRMTLLKEGDLFYRVETDGQNTLLTALLLGDKFRLAAEQALETGAAFVRYTDAGGDYYATLTLTGGDRLTVLTAESARYQQTAREGAAATALILWIAAGVVLVMMLMILTSLSRNLRRVTKGLTAIQNGSYVEVVDHGGDEVSAMANSLNSMARTLRDADAQNLRRGDVYARFLPTRIADLLGVPSVEDINKQSFAFRTMTTMHVKFTFAEQVYASRSKELFDNINEVTESTAKIISDQGGVILTFSHDEFDALFEPDSNAPVSAAVAIRQEIISINRERVANGLSPVSLRVTLDIGEVMLGVVGDEKRMQATAVSSSFNTARKLDALLSRFEANILCTERIERWTGEYGTRYIGKAHDGNELVRVYEIYDGDTYAVRQGKEETDRVFSDGVYTLYTGDYSAAKRIFMEIVRRNNGDGVAKYYLYLADRFEKEPPEKVCLDC